jgi:hypothetical protein
MPPTQSHSHHRHGRRPTTVPPSSHAAHRLCPPNMALPCRCQHTALPWTLLIATVVHASPLPPACHAAAQPPPTLAAPSTRTAGSTPTPSTTLVTTSSPATAAATYLGTSPAAALQLLAHGCLGSCLRPRPTRPGLAQSNHPQLAAAAPPTLSARGDYPSRLEAAPHHHSAALEAACHSRGRTAVTVVEPPCNPHLLMRHCSRTPPSAAPQLPTHGVKLSVCLCRIRAATAAAVMQPASTPAAARSHADVEQRSLCCSTPWHRDPRPLQPANLLPTDTDAEQHQHPAHHRNTGLPSTAAKRNYRAVRRVSCCRRRFTAAAAAVWLRCS